MGRPARKPEVPATPTNLAIRLANNSPLLAADPTDSRFVVLANRIDSPDFGCSLQISGDGGRSWLTADPVRTLPGGVDKCYGPEVAFDRDGLLYYLFVGLQGRGNTPTGAFLTTSRDRGRTFSAPRKVLSGSNFQVRMALDRTRGDKGRLHLIWQHANSLRLGGFAAPGNPILAAHSDDGGRTFSPPVQVSDPERRRAVAPALALGPDGAVHVLYYDLRGDFRDYEGRKGPTWQGKWALVMASSTDGGRRFRRGVVVDADVVPPERVMLIFTMPTPAVSTGPAGRVYVAWHDARNGDWDVFLRRSTDRGATWSTPQRLNDDRRRNGRHQYLPRLSVAPGGRVDAIWYDRRGNVENRGNDVYHAYSTDGGATFSPNLKLTSRDSDSEIGQVYEIPSALGPPLKKEFGSRIALLAERSRTLAAWTDTSSTGRAPPSQDIHATELVFASSGGDRGWLRVAGGALALAGLLALAARYRGLLRRKAATATGDADR